MMFDKKGEAGKTVPLILGIILLVVVLSGPLIWMISDSVNSLADGYGVFGQGVLDIGGPLFSMLLGLDNAGGDNAFLMLLSFILIMIIIVNTLDAIHIFGENNNWLNFAVGTIVSIIGVRFMPTNLWEALAAPSSALVATVLVGLPFLALTMITIKMQGRLARKLLWTFYLTFMSYVIFRGADSIQANEFKFIYLGFLVAGVVMLFADAKIKKLLNAEKAKEKLESDLNVYNTEREIELQERIKSLVKTRDRAKSGSSQRADLDREVNSLLAEFKQVTGREFNI